MYKYPFKITPDTYIMALVHLVQMMGHLTLQMIGHWKHMISTIQNQYLKICTDNTVIGILYKCPAGKLSHLHPPPHPALSTHPHPAGGGGVMDIFWNYTIKFTMTSIWLHVAELSAWFLAGTLYRSSWHFHHKGCSFLEFFI